MKKNENLSNIGLQNKYKQIAISEFNPNEFFFQKKDKNLSIIIKIMFIMIYFSIIILIEKLYRDYLFQVSIPFQENIQKNKNYLIILKISRRISTFGKEKWYFFIYGVIFLLLPLNHSLLALQALIYSSYWTNTLKMVYKSDRPNWRSDYLTFLCNYGYGNPSGHAFTCFTFYLTLAHILIAYWKITGIRKIITFIFFSLFSFFIALSRIIVGAHSINQIIYGYSLGLGFYFILIHIIGYHKYFPNNFLHHIKKKKINYIYLCFHLFLFILSVVIYLFTETKDHSDLESTIFNGIRCKIKNPYSKYKNEGLFKSLNIWCLIGAQLGIYLLFKFLKASNYVINGSIIEWNKSNIYTFLLRMPIIILSSFGLIFYFFIPGNSPLMYVFVFKSGLSSFITMVGIHFVGVYLSIYFKVANSEIFKMDVLSEIISEI